MIETDTFKWGTCLQLKAKSMCVYLNLYQVIQYTGRKGDQLDKINEMICQASVCKTIIYHNGSKQVFGLKMMQKGR